MNPTTTRFGCWTAANLLTMFLLLLAGCYYPADGQTGYAMRQVPVDSVAPESGVPTSLVIVVEGECTEAQYVARRSEIINYLIDRGFIQSESDLIADPDLAERIIRAVVTPEGYTLSIFNKNPQEGPPPDLEDSDLLYPADPYFIWGFLYAGEIGLRHLPPRPPGYRPHPRPLHEGPPPGHPIYDQNRHWSHPAQPGRNVRPPTPTGPDHHETKATGPGPRPNPPGHEERPNDHGQPQADGRRPSSNAAYPAPKLEQALPANSVRAVPSPNNNPSRQVAPPAPHNVPPPSHAGPIRPAEGPRPSVNPPPPNSSQPRAIAPPPRYVAPPPREGPPPSRPAPAPAPAPAEKSPPQTDDKDTSHRAQN